MASLNCVLSVVVIDEMSGLPPVQACWAESCCVKSRQAAKQNKVIFFMIVVFCIKINFYKSPAYQTEIITLFHLIITLSHIFWPFWC